jgi:HlyD family secretion protein
VNRRVAIALITILVIAAAGGYAIRKRGTAAAAAGQTLYKITKAQTGDVKKTVSSSGVLQPWNVVDIKARAGGELALLAVDVGSEVTKGQILARIDPLDVQLALNTAQADETSARAREQQSAKTYQLQIQQSQIAIRDAEASLLSARANLAAAQARLATARKQSGAQPELTRTAIANAQASYEQARKQRQQLESTNPQQRASAKAAYDQALANQKNARQSVERQQALLAKGFVSQQAVDTAQANVSVTDAQVTSAKARLDTIDAELSATVEAADARVRQARAALDSARAGSIDIANRGNAVREAEAAVRQSQAQVARSQVAVDQARANQANNAIRSFDVKAAGATIARAEASRINAQAALERTVLRAPSNGVVLQKYVEQGTIITSGMSLSSAGTSIVQLGDTSRMYVDVNVDETDIANVDEGQTVEVNIEAYPGVPFEGKVVRVDPRAQVEQNVTTVHVRVEVDNSAPTFRLLKPGMNATCEFVISQKEGVVSVPNEALHEDDKGRFVEVAEGGKPAPADPATGIPADPDTLVDIKKKRVAVEVGIEGNDSTEIVSGVKAGDPIITQTIEPAPTTAQGSPFGGGGMGGGRGGFGGGGGGRGGGR